MTFHQAFISLPTALPTSAPTLSTTPKCSVAMPRRQALRLAAVLSVAPFLPPAHAFSTYERIVKSNVAKLQLGLAKAKALKETVSQWKESMTEDDSLFVLRYMPIWLETARVAMDNICKQEQVDIGDRKQAQQLALAMKGHMLELNMEALNRSTEGVSRELDEFVETAEDFLNLAGITRFVK